MTDTPPDPQLTFETVGLSSKHLADVKELGHKYSNTLGHLPNGAFDDAAEKQRIIAAVNLAGQCLGYVLYRIARERVSITHLCVDESGRRHGIATQLVEHLIEKTKVYQGVGLRCRVDYNADRFWPKLGFVQQGSMPGRSKDGSTTLTIWWRDNGHRNLFNQRKPAGQRVLGAIDANVFFDLIAEEGTRPQGEESRFLAADWLQEHVELAVTEEIFNEIYRGDPAKRAQTERKAKLFGRLECKAAAFDRIRNELVSKFPTEMADRDHADLHQLSRAIAGGAAYFVTRDSRILELSEQVQEQYGLIILSPTDLILRLDEVVRATEYQPSRLAESPLTVRRVGSGDEDQLLPFRRTNEANHTWRQLVRSLLADTRTVDFKIVSNEAGEAIAAMALTNLGDTTEIALLRVRHSPVDSTIFRQLLRQALLASHRNRHGWVVFKETAREAYTEPALYDFGFKQTDVWMKYNLFGVLSNDELRAGLMKISKYREEEERWLTELTDPNCAADFEWAAFQEVYLWPGKLAESDLPNYIVPIRPQWAEQLFDDDLARQSLFGRAERLAMNTEGVYYRSGHGNVHAPARILWYVSEDSNTLGAKALRACSRLEAVTKGLPKELFRENRRLGVYEWRHVYETAKKDIRNPLMALRFSGTELFKTKISWKELQESLQNHGVRSTIVEPARISKALFADLYRRGTV